MGIVPVLGTSLPGRGNDRLFGFDGLAAAAVVAMLRSNALPLHILSEVARYVADLNLSDGSTGEEVDPGFLVVTHNGTIAQLQRGKLEAFISSDDYPNNDVYVVDLLKFSRSLRGAAMETLFFGRPVRGRKRGSRNTMRWKQERQKS